MKLIFVTLTLVAAPAAAYLLTRWQKQREQYRPETWTRNNLHFVLTGERRWEEPASLDEDTERMKGLRLR